MRSLPTFPLPPFPQAKRGLVIQILLLEDLQNHHRMTFIRAARPVKNATSKKDAGSKIAPSALKLLFLQVIF